MNTSIQRLVDKMTKDVESSEGPHEAAAYFAAYFKEIRRWKVLDTFLNAESVTSDFVDSMSTKGKIRADSHEMVVMATVARSSGCKLLYGEMFILVGQEDLVYLAERVGTCLLKQVSAHRVRYVENLTNLGISNTQSKLSKLEYYSHAWAGAIKSKEVRLHVPNVVKTHIQAKLDKLSEDWDILELEDGRSPSFRAV